MSQGRPHHRDLDPSDLDPSGPDPRGPDLTNPDRGPAGHSDPGYPSYADRVADPAAVIDELELELRRVRCQATAARLEARIAELQLMLRRATADAAQASTPPREAPPSSAPPPRHTSWKPLAAAARRRRPPEAAPTARADAAIGDAVDANPAPPLPPRPAPRPLSPRKRAKTSPSQLGTLSRPSTPQRPPRKKPAAWILSTVLHGALLGILAAFSLSVHNPQDQVALIASAANVPETANLQVLELESLQELQETALAELPERPPELDPLGALPPAPPPSLPGLSESAAITPDSLSQLLDDQQMMTALTADPQASTQFCGVEGGGNHFVYIVDSSQSMKDGRFESARRELLQAIDSLNAQQRFYIIFYDIQIDRMCVTHPTQPDEYSLLASDENKRRARRWAMSVTLQRGAPPDEALAFALQLRPDVIFLLSDGEFPQRIEELMAQRNRTSNLFGESGPISILHTIGYHSRDGETRMRRLAADNGGQYRYIPKP